jgi:putative transposase
MKGWRHSLNALLYLVKTGCQWRFLPKEYGNWKTTYSVFWRWRRAGVWKRLSDGLRERLRLQMNREAQPSVAIIDSQSVKTVQKGRQRGYDAGKKIKGRKRHIAVDTLGLLLVVVVHSAGIQDRVGARAVLAALYRDTTRLVKVFADGGYTGQLIDWCRQRFQWTLEVVKRTELHTFKVLPKRWIVERTFSWLNLSRRLSKDYEINPRHSETMVYIAMSHLMVKRLARI